MNAGELTEGWDVVIVHDPQPLRDPPAGAGEGDATGSGAATSTCPRRNPRRSTGSPPYCTGYDGAVFHLRDYVPGALDRRRAVHICPPAIDPLSPKNMALSPEDAAFVVDQFGIDVDRPLMCQVSRFDPWKDPLA